LAVVTIREVRKALDICAPDWKEHLTDHRIQIHWNGKIGRLPSGGHGKKNEFPIQWVRTLGGIELAGALIVLSMAATVQAIACSETIKPPAEIVACGSSRRPRTSWWHRADSRC
jgi:hypothetical protein